MAADLVKGNVLYFLGTALYQRAEFDHAPQILRMTDGSNTHFYTAQCWYEKAGVTADVTTALTEAESDLKSAIASGQPESLEIAGYHKLLGKVYTMR